jgi:hypothetical protein
VGRFSGLTNRRSSFRCVNPLSYEEWSGCNYGEESTWQYCPTILARVGSVTIRSGRLKAYEDQSQRMKGNRCQPRKLTINWAPPTIGVNGVNSIQGAKGEVKESEPSVMPHSSNLKLGSGVCVTRSFLEPCRAPLFLRTNIPRAVDWDGVPTSWKYLYGRPSGEISGGEN